MSKNKNFMSQNIWQDLGHHIQNCIGKIKMSENTWSQEWKMVMYCCFKSYFHDCKEAEHFSFALLSISSYISVNCLFVQLMYFFHCCLPFLFESKCGYFCMLRRLPLVCYPLHWNLSSHFAYIDFSYIKLTISYVVSYVYICMVSAIFLDLLKKLYCTTKLFKNYGKTYVLGFWMNEEIRYDKKS